jgi:hypothetical protein
LGIVGIWIDHSQATLVTIEASKSSLTRIESGAEKQQRQKGGSRLSTPHGAQEIVRERRAEERRKHQLHHFYGAVLHAVRDAERIFVCGPGQAKVEFEKELRKSKALSHRLVGIEPADKMTDNQLVAHIKRCFWKAESATEMV